MAEENIVKPFLKWVGGKSQIIELLMARYPEQINNYYDIFLGGGSTLLALLSYVRDKKIIVTGQIYAYDINSDLINVYKNVQKYPNELWGKIKKIIDEFYECSETDIIRQPKNEKESKTSQESYYYWIRQKYNRLSSDEKSGLDSSAMFIFLNKTCFRGIYRVGPNGLNVPFGHYAGPKIIDKETLLSVSQLIEHVKFKCIDFTQSLKTPFGQDDFIYLDPPYVQEKKTSFVKYDIAGFDIAQHKRLFAMCQNLMSNGCQFMMTNSASELVISSFEKEKYLVDIIECRRAIHAKNPAKKAKEVIIRTVRNY